MGGQPLTNEEAWRVYDVPDAARTRRYCPPACTPKTAFFRWHNTAHRAAGRVTPSQAGLFAALFGIAA
jgi:hypothetical protein